MADMQHDHVVTVHVPPPDGPEGDRVTLDIQLAESTSRTHHLSWHSARVLHARLSRALEDSHV